METESKPDSWDELQELRISLSRRPADIALRLRYTRRLLELDHPQDAWHQCARLLHENPRHIEALELAQESAAACGVRHRAEEYAGRLEAARAGRNWQPPRPQPPPPPAQKTYRIKGRSLRLIRGGQDRSTQDHGNQDHSTQGRGTQE